jgi:alpha-L-arabinofuranosidase
MLDMVKIVHRIQLSLSRLLLCVAATLAAPLSLHAQETLTIHTNQSSPKISRDVFGQFSEHLGEGIYGGVWVGKDSQIPNVRGIRSDVVQALREIHAPVVRWPGGCFADGYHWRDGIGPESQRRKRLNADWGGVIEPNTFGTHEYMDFIEQIGSEAYISVNLGSGTVQEAADWLEYMTTVKSTSLGLERVANGRAKPWRIKYIGYGNESWGCGGAFTPTAYVDKLKQFSHFVINYNPEQANPSVPEFLVKLNPAKPDFSALDPSPNGMRRIAVGPDGTNTEYTEGVMKAWQSRQPFFWGIEGISLHSYTFGHGFPMSSSSTQFGEDEYAGMLKETMAIDGLLAVNSAIMDKYDPAKKVALVVDEWGAWLRPVPGGNPVFLRQQNSMRDAILAAINLNIFARHADRVRMTNIAQMINVIQSMILTDGAKMVLTPTYFIYKMYVPFQDADFIPTSYRTGEYRAGDKTLPQIDAIAARSKDGKLWLSVINIDPKRSLDFPVKIDGASAKLAEGEVLTAAEVNSINTFEKPDAVLPVPYIAKASSNGLVMHLKPKSVTVVQIR